MLHPTLAKRVTTGIERGHLTLNNDPDEVRLQCAYCTDDLLIDYFQLGVGPMNREIAKFVAHHQHCKVQEGMARLLACAAHDETVTCPVCAGDAPQRRDKPCR